MNNNLPFYKNKLSSALLISILVGAVPFSAHAMPNCDEQFKMAAAWAEYDFLVDKGETPDKPGFELITVKTVKLRCTPPEMGGDPIERQVPDQSVLELVQKKPNSPAAGVARLMDKLISLDDDGNLDNLDFKRLLTALSQLDEAKVLEAVSQLLPSNPGTRSAALSGGVGAISQVVQSRAEGSQGMSSGDAMPGEKQGQIFDDSYMWLKGFGSMADQGTVGGITGFDADSSGLVIGLDGAPTDKDRIGLAFAYAQTDVDSKDNLNRVDINTYQLVGYGSHSLTDDTQLSYQASYGVHQSEGSRNISIVSTIATSDFDSTSMGAGFGLLHSFKISDQLTITPSLRNDYTYMDNDGYTETGAGSLSLIVDSNDSEQWLFDLSSKAVYGLTESINLTGNLGASYDVINEQSTSLSAFAGSPGNVFTTQGLKSDPWLYSAGIGLVMETDSGTTITAHYDYSTRDDFDNQSISLKARWMF
jgi:outer membrane autotransporter protein